MKVSSTRDSNSTYTLSEAMEKGLADDGGLFIPVTLPDVDLSSLSTQDTYASFATKLLDYFFKDDKLESHLEAIAAKAFNFPLPLKQLDNNTYLLETFHGPTGSFKDFGARFLAECLQVIRRGKAKSTILVATSGDTGSAVAAAFHKKEFANIIVLYPKGKISETQEKQITCWGDNVLALAVNGSFDDCQALVKSAYQECKGFNLSTANSINLGRLLPQMIYYAYTAFHFYHEHQQEAGFIIPSGNLGNITAAYWAKEIGFPIREIAMATNENKVMTDYKQTGEFSPRKSLATHANAMDVGNPSNFERLKTLFKTSENFVKNLNVTSVSDKDIETTIKDVAKQYDEIICPHTATAFFMRKQLSDNPWIIVATAEPGKFEDIVEPCIEHKVSKSKQLLNLLEKESHFVEISADLESLIGSMEIFSSE